jgi:hypothetical protein
MKAFEIGKMRLFSSREGTSLFILMMMMIISQVVSLFGGREREG